MVNRGHRRLLLEVRYPCEKGSMSQEIEWTLRDFTGSLIVSKTILCCLTLVLSYYVSVTYLLDTKNNSFRFGRDSLTLKVNFFFYVTHVVGCGH